MLGAGIIPTEGSRGVRRALVTGATSDIGHALCLRYLAAGCGVVAHYRTDCPRIAELGRHNDVTLIAADFSEADALDNMISRNRALIASCDILIHAAALLESAPFGSITADHLLRAFQVNAVPFFLLMQAMVPVMCDRGFGRIVALGSIGVKYGGGKDSLPYSLSKHACEFLPAGHRQWATHNVLINTMRVGATDTRFHKRKAGWDPKARVALIPAGRFAKPEEIAEAAFWLGSDANSFMTGQVIAVAGGE